MAMKIMPKTMTGQLHSLNKGACDWGWQRLLAYGCQSCVVVVDPSTIQNVQVLDHQHGQVVCVKWARENYRHETSSPYSLRLAAADTTGRIVVWDVSRAVVIAECLDGGSRPVADMEWIGVQDASHDMLAALHPPSSLILWNTENGSRLWKKTYSDVLMSFSFDPFDPSRLAFLGQDCILFVDDFSLSGAPMSGGKKFHVSSPKSAGVPNSTSADRLSDKRAGSSSSSSTKSTMRRVSGILVGGDGQWKTPPGEDDGSMATMRDCIQLAYHRACRQHLILVYSREVLILDLDIGQTVCVVPTERTGSPFVYVATLRECDALICFHESGAMSVRSRKQRPPAVGCRPSTSEIILSPSSSSSSPDDDSNGVDVVYTNRCQSDSLRITKHNRLMSAAVCPVTERQSALVTNDGRVLVWQISLVESALTSGSDIPRAPILSLADLISHVDDRRATAALNGGTGSSLSVRLIMTGLLNGLLSAPTIVRMCPPLTTKNFNVYRPLLSVGGGGSVGTVQIYDLSGGFLWREFAVHTCPVRGIEWISRRGFLSFAYPTTSSSANANSGGGVQLVRNEIMLTDIDTGRSVPLRTNVDDESPIESLRASYLKQYFAILFKDRPFELWDLRTLTLLRRMPRTFPQVTALEWSPSHGGSSKSAASSKAKKATTPDATNGGSAGESTTTTPSEPAPMSSSAASGSSMLDLATTPSCQTPSSDFGDDRPLPTAASSSSSTTVVASIREHFVFTDINGLLYHFIIEGNVVRDGSKIPPDSGMGSITCIAWKAETLVLSDVDGNLNIWDLRGKVSRAVGTGRGWIRKIKFAPGRGNMKLVVLYFDGNGVDVWDAKDVERVTSLRCPKDIANKVIDVEWAASDRPVLLCADGCVRVADVTCMTSFSPIEDYQLLEPVFCPHALPPRVGLCLHSLLQQRADYRDEYQGVEESADYSAVGGGSLDGSIQPAVSAAVAEHIDLLDPLLRRHMDSPKCGIAERCMLTARLFGDESELTFWTVARHYIQTQTSASASAVSDNLLTFDDNNDDAKRTEIPAAGVDAAAAAVRPLGTCLDVVRDNRTFGDDERARAALHDRRRTAGESTRRCADALLLLGDADRAVQLLLETDPSADSDKFYVDSLRACLVASVRSSGNSQSTIKLVATNLIACGRLSEGVQLLCLIDKGADACRYLQTYGQWREAARLAKTILPQPECSDVMKRWADHLSSPAVDRHSLAALVLLSLGKFSAVVDLLLGMRHFDRAALFVDACRESGLLVDDCPAAETTYAGYARLLFALGLQRLFENYCLKAGEQGKALLAELRPQ